MKPLHALPRSLALLVPLASAALGAEGAVAPAPAAAPTSVVETTRDALDDAVRSSMDQAVADLEALAARCQKEKQFLQRNETYKLLITLVPDHKLGRKTLGYKWNRKEETWEAPKRPKTPKDKDPETTLPLMEARDAVLTDHRDRVLAAMGSSQASEKRKRAITRGLVALLPEDASLREAIGQVKHEGKWVEASTARALTQMKAHKDRVRDLKKGQPEPEAAEATPMEGTLGQMWSGKLKTKNLRVLGTASKTELTRVAKTCQATVEYLNELFGTQPIKDANVYVLQGEGSKNAFMDKWPGLEPDKRTLYKRLFAVYVDYDNLASQGSDEKERLDAAVRLNVYRHLNHNYLIYEQYGWANEGFGMYLTWQMTGTRLIFFVRDTEYTDPSELDLSQDKLKKNGSDWLKLAKKELTGKKKVNMSFVLGRDVNQLTTRDVLISYALAAYLIEGQEPGVAAKVLTRVGKGENSAMVLEQELGFSPPQLAEELAKWLDQIGK